MSTQSKVIFWNIWGHRYSDGVHNFLEEHNDADVFCLTEVTDASQQQINKNGHNLVYSGDEAASEVDGLAQLQDRFDDNRYIFYDTADYRDSQCIQTGARFNKVGFGSALLVRSDVTIVVHGAERLIFDDEIKSRVLQWLVYEKNQTRYLVAHLHGVWIRGNTKGDHIIRQIQSQLVCDALSSISSVYNVDKIIFGGDLNLDINTDALRLLEGVQYRNLIREYDITNTRTTLYRHLGLAGHSMYADYVLVGQNVHVDSFAVHNDVLASDHAPLIVQFS